MVPIYFFLVVIISVTVAADNCTTEQVFTSIDQANTNMIAEEQLLAINVVTNATLLGGTDQEIVSNIFYNINPNYPSIDRNQIWIVIQKPAIYHTWVKSKITLTACTNCNVCAKYLIFYVSGNTRYDDNLLTSPTDMTDPMGPPYKSLNN